MNSPGIGDTTDLPHAVQVDAWRRMGAQGRSEMGAELRRKVRIWKQAALRDQHPDWTADRLQRELARMYLRGNT